MRGRNSGEKRSVTISLPDTVKRSGEGGKGRNKKKGSGDHAGLPVFLDRFKPKLEALARREGFGRTSDARTEQRRETERHDFVARYCKAERRGRQRAKQEKRERRSRRTPCFWVALSRSSKRWRGERDSNPRYGSPYTRFPIVRLRPAQPSPHTDILSPKGGI